MIHPLLKNIDAIDFSNAKLAKDFGDLFINYANLLGWGLRAPIAAPIRSEMRKIGGKWLKGMADSFERMSTADALAVLNTYDFVFRLIYSSAPDPKFTYRIISNALESLIRGDIDVDVYELYRRIDNGINTHIGLYKEKPMKWLSITLDKWHKEFKTGKYVDPKPLKTYAGGFARIADNDVLARVSVLLNTDLFAFEYDQKTFKRCLFDNHRHYLDRLILEESSDYNIPTLMSIGSFIYASYPFLTSDERDRYREAASAELYIRTDSPYIRASLERISEANKQYC